MQLARWDTDAAGAAFVEALAAFTAQELGVRLTLSDQTGNSLVLGPPAGPAASPDL